jgi:hypothetical protein
MSIGLLGRYQFKEALTSFQPHHAAPRRAAESQTALTMLICEEPHMGGYLDPGMRGRATGVYGRGCRWDANSMNASK